MAEILLLFLRLFQILEERFAFGTEFFFETTRAIAIATGPRLGTVPIAAIATGMGVLDADQLEILFPIGTLLGERRGAKAGFDPVRGAVLGDAGLAHVVQVFITGDGALAERAGLDRGQQRLCLSGFQTGFDQVTHEDSIVVRREIATEIGQANV